MSAVGSRRTVVAEVRPWRDGDLERLRDAEPSFSSATLTSRFMVGTRTLPQAYLAALRRRPAGDRRRPIEVAVVDGRLVALGEGFVNDDGAEIAIFVADAWQRQGIGTRLLTALLERFRSAGVTHVRAESALSNTSVSALAGNSRRSWVAPAGWHVSGSTGAGVRRFDATYEAGAEAA